MDTAQIERLSHRLCPRKTGDEYCSGYLYSSITTTKDNVYRCRECHNYVYEVDYDLLMLMNNKYTKNEQTEEIDR